jgi:hypothetical protein
MESWALKDLADPRVLREIKAHKVMLVSRAIKETLVA